MPLYLVSAQWTHAAFACSTGSNGDAIDYVTPPLSLSGKSIGSPSCNFWQSETATNYPDPISGYVKNAAVGWGMGFQSTSRASHPTGCDSYDALWEMGHLSMVGMAKEGPSSGDVQQRAQCPPDHLTGGQLDASMCTSRPSNSEVGSLYEHRDHRTSRP